MYYIRSVPTISGNYGNPAGRPFSDCLKLPDEHLSAYITSRGFVDLVLDGDTVVLVKTNQVAFDAYLEGYPDKTSEPESNDDLEKKMMQAQISAQSDRIEFLEDCIAEMAMQVYGGV